MSRSSGSTCLAYVLVALWRILDRGTTIRRSTRCILGLVNIHSRTRGRRGRANTTQSRHTLKGRGGPKARNLRGGNGTTSATEARGRGGRLLRGEKGNSFLDAAANDLLHFRGGSFTSRWSFLGRRRRIVLIAVLGRGVAELAFASLTLGEFHLW
ncbi:hypothetical protein BDZ89DRAFT_799208 [Hymenopellis radicata]|nr:hypothetical protein BDZ89DRAFT_799208 [Hymenopellis radicata]